MLLPLLMLLSGGQTPAAACPAISPPHPALSGSSSMRATPGIGAHIMVAGSSTIAGLTEAESARGGTAAIVPIKIANPGIYSIALGEAAWIDAVQGGKTLVSVGHEHGAACTGIRKIVRFAFSAGAVQLRISGMKTPRIGVRVTRHKS